MHGTSPTHIVAILLLLLQYYNTAFKFSCIISQYKWLFPVMQCHVVLQGKPISALIAILYMRQV